MDEGSILLYVKRSTEPRKLVRRTLTEEYRSLGSPRVSNGIVGSSEKRAETPDILDQSQHRIVSVAVDH